MSKVLVVGGIPFSLVNFRGDLLKAMTANGHKVFVASNGHDLKTEGELRVIGIEYHPVSIARTGTSFFVDLLTLLDLIRLIRRIRPDVVLSYTIKPVIFGGLAAQICGIKNVYSIITGLGYAFMETGRVRQRLVSWVARVLYALSLKRNCKVFFQNPDDAQLFNSLRLVLKENTVVVNGSGVNLTLFPFSHLAKGEKQSTKHFRFLLIARLLRDKGIVEYVRAARVIKKSYPWVEFHLVGSFDPNPTGLKAEEIQNWEKSEIIKFHGYQADVRPFIDHCDVYVLPSFREGTPRTVLEAMAMGRAVITTDAPGCRETVRFPGGVTVQSVSVDGDNLKFGLNGILIPVKNVSALVRAMEFFLMHPDQVEVMGKESRRYAEERYDVYKVNVVLMQEMGL